LINLSYQFLSENSRFFGGKQMSNVEIVTNIDIASEIAHATVTEVLANMDNERIGYVLIGVLQQLETIQDNVNNFNLKEQDKATKEVA
jgi:hypothetical protein